MYPPPFLNPKEVLDMILAIGNSGSYEFSAFKSVLQFLRARGQDALLFKQDKCLEGEYLIFEIVNGKSYYFVVIDGEKYDIDDFSSIWYMKPHLPRELIEFEIAEYRHFIHTQFYIMRTALWSIFSHKIWIDDPWVICKADNKLYQLELAAKVGFLLPETIITSDPEAVKRFYYGHNKGVVTKILLSSPMIDNVIYTNILNDGDIDNISSLRLTPAIFQACITKSYELRITVVGDTIFPVKIYSQEDERIAIDWRRKPKLNDFEVKMEQVSLPTNIEQMIRSFMKEIGLRFGCIDMIVTPNGDYVFLEINPSGQWYFVQLRTEAQIAEAIAKLLVG